MGGLIMGWPGLAAALFGQISALYLWILGHELLHRHAADGARLVKVHHRLVGPWPNQLSLWLTLVALPGFWLVRLLEVLAYPVLIRLLDFPRYRHSEWINLSRHKVQDLVGHDLVWCLYCDWMTGVWALGTEMLRNVESFWCPIQFPDETKNHSSSIDFPDAANGWIPPDASVAEAAELVDAMYRGGRRSWFGHPDRRIEGVSEPLWKRRLSVCDACDMADCMMKRLEPCERQARAKRIGLVCPEDRWPDPVAPL